MRKKRGGVIRRLKKHATRATARRDQTVCETFGLEELFEISDRIAVLAQGRLSPAMPKSETNAETVGMMMSGLFDEAAAHKEAGHAFA